MAVPPEFKPDIEVIMREVGDYTGEQIDDSTVFTTDDRREIIVYTMNPLGQRFYFLIQPDSETEIDLMRALGPNTNGMNPDNRSKSWDALPDELKEVENGTIG